MFKRNALTPPTLIVPQLQDDMINNLGSATHHQYSIAVAPQSHHERDSAGSIRSKHGSRLSLCDFPFHTREEWHFTGLDIGDGPQGLLDWRLIDVQSLQMRDCLRLSVMHDKGSNLERCRMYRSSHSRQVSFSLHDNFISNIQSGSDFQAPSF